MACTGCVRLRYKAIDPPPTAATPAPVNSEFVQEAYSGFDELDELDVDALRYIEFPN